MKNLPDKMKSKNIINTFIKLLAAAAAIIIVFWGSYYYIVNSSYNKYEKQMILYINKVNKVNKSASSFVKSNGLISDTNKIKSGLSSLIKQLEDIKSDTEDLSATDRYKLMSKSFQEGLDDNITIYKQCLAILENPESPDMDDSVKDLENLKSTCISNYTNVNIRNSIISLPYCASSLIDDIINRTNQLVKIKKNKEILQSQIVDFITSINDLSEKFKDIKKDYTASLKDIRNGKDTYDNLLSSINQASDSLDSLTKDFDGIAIPNNDAENISSSFNSLLNDYSDYLKSISFAVNNEKTQAASGPLDSDSLSSMYYTADSKYKNLDEEYLDFTKNFLNYKSSNK